MSNPLKLLARMAWIAWSVVVLITLAATYGPVESTKLPAGTPYMTRVVLPGAQDSSAAAFSLIRFSRVQGFGRTHTFDGSSQFWPVPLLIGLWLLLGFLDINIGGPSVGKRKEAM